MPQIKTGIVTGSRMTKTVVVCVATKVKHPFYKKLITRTKKFKVHDELGVKMGQQVKIIETKPISKEVHFKVLKVIG